MLEKYEESIECYDESIKIDSKDDMGWSNKGESLVCLDRYEEAMACYDESSKIKEKVL